MCFETFDLTLLKVLFLKVPKKHIHESVLSINILKGIVHPQKINSGCRSKPITFWLVFWISVVTVPKFQYSVSIPVKIHGSRYQSKTQKYAN